MATTNYFSSNDPECVPDPYFLLGSEPSYPDFSKPPAAPVSTHLSVPSFLAPSVPDVSSPPVTHQPPLSPSSFRSDSSSESSDTFDDFQRTPLSTTSPSRGSRHNPFDSEFGRAPSTSESSLANSTAATSLTSPQDHIEPLPVSLPIGAPEWIQIFSGLSHNGGGDTEDFVRVVTEDSRRIGYLKEIKASREHNRLADLHNEPLTPIPNISGLVMPLGYHHSITSVSQLYDMPITELDDWLLHYGIRTPPAADFENLKQRTLARHLGVVTPDNNLDNDALAVSPPPGESVSL
ncbi:hypothetical protein FRC01_006393 [Tulasnella sp. 417]|nr:hypothetical protein FRC01_006393 [Tulasnella sp. 417]